MQKRDGFYQHRAEPHYQKSSRWFPWCSAADAGRFQLCGIKLEFTPELKWELCYPARLSL
ncbi:hypothetical protein KCP77_01185 [Salmonella enterica subsp. enterica]|nr:hypothetical protein KCP77_01185 [Salmonella enterica subsp. enterica]